MAQRGLAYYYGLFAVLVVASVQLFFSLEKGGYFQEQWRLGAVAILAALVGGALVPGYLSSPSVGRNQWTLVGSLLLFAAVVAASILWSVSPDLSMLEASRTVMYAGAFVLLLPAAVRWGPLLVDATVLGALLPPAIYGLLEKILPTTVKHAEGVARPVGDPGYTFETYPSAASTIGYHVTFGLMCAMGALLAVARVGSFRSVPLRALYSAVGTLFLVAMYFSFSRGALWALAVGALVLLILAERRFEVLANMAISTLPALWVVSQARDYPGLVSRPIDQLGRHTLSLSVIEADGLALIAPLLKAVLLAVAAQVLFTVLIRALAKFIPDEARSVLRIASMVVAAALVSGGLFLGWSVFQQAGGFDELRSKVTSSDDEIQREASTTDQTKRLSSLTAAGGRITSWKIAWENWREHPFTGTGGDTFRAVEDVYAERYAESLPEGWQEVPYPHSMWMILLSDTGIFAFLAFAAFCVGCLALAFYNAFFGARGHRRSRALIAGSAAAAGAYLVSSSVDANWYIPASTLPFFTLAAVVAVGPLQWGCHREEQPPAASS